MISPAESKVEQIRQKRRDEKYCVIIPSYMEAKRIAEVVSHVLRYVKAVVVIDDGSADATSEEARKAGATVIRHDINKGKAAALKTGLDYARNCGFHVVICMDGDGQHDPDDIPTFIEAYVRTGVPALIGNRMGDLTNMPLIRQWTNKFTSWFLSREMNQYVPDTQCGYRLYRCDIIPFVSADSERFAAESEILLRIADHGLRIDAVPIKTVYRDEKSKIRPFKDSIRFFSMMRRYRKSRKQA